MSTSRLKPSLLLLLVFLLVSRLFVLNLLLLLLLPLTLLPLCFGRLIRVLLFGFRCLLLLSEAGTIRMGRCTASTAMRIFIGTMHPPMTL